MKPLFLSLLALLPLPALAAHYGVRSSNAEGPVLALTQDMMYPNWTNNHYIACVTQRFKTQEGWTGYFYGGVVPDLRGGKTLLQTSSWQVKGEGVPEPAVNFTYAGHHMSWARSTWEGSAGGIKGYWPPNEFRAGSWYRWVITTWPGPGEKPDHTFVGQWLKDISTGQWHLLGTIRYCGNITDLGTIGGFHENASVSSPNSSPLSNQCLRNTYTFRRGKWCPEPIVTLKPQKLERVKVTLLDGGTTAQLRTAWDNTKAAQNGEKAGPELLNQPDSQTYQLPAQPNFFDPILVENFSASQLDGQLLIHWEIPGKSSPQVSYNLELFDQPDCKGKPLFTLTGHNPLTRDLLLPLSKQNATHVRLTIRDIYSNLSKPFTCAISRATPLPAPASTPQGPLRYAYYEAPEGTHWTALPDFTKLKPTLTGTLAEPDITSRARRSQYAFQFDGPITITQKGLHRFTLISASGSKLFIDEKLVVDFDGDHSIAPKSGTIALSPGTHRLQIQYFQGDERKMQTDDFLQLAWETPGQEGKPTRIPASAFTSGNTPSAFTPSVTPSPDDATRIQVVTRSAVPSKDIARIRYYLENPHFDYFSEQGVQGTSYFLGQTQTPDQPLQLPIWGPSAKTLRARIYLKNGTTLDSAPLAFTLPAPNLGPWQISQPEHHLYPVAASVHDQTVSLVGESMCLLTRPLTGDGEIIAHLADITSNDPYEDGSDADANGWMAGIIMRHHLLASPGSPLGGKTHYASVLSKVSGDLCYCDSLMHTGAGNQPKRASGKASRWMKIVRKGNTFTSFSSKEGKTWDLINTTELPEMNRTLHAGFFLYSLPSASTVLHRATFDHVEVTQTAP